MGTSALAVGTLARDRLRDVLVIEYLLNRGVSGLCLERPSTKSISRFYVSSAFQSLEHSLARNCREIYVSVLRFACISKYRGRARSEKVVELGFVAFATRPLKTWKTNSRSPNASPTHEFDLKWTHFGSGKGDGPFGCRFYVLPAFQSLEVELAR